MVALESVVLEVLTSTPEVPAVKAATVAVAFVAMPARLKGLFGEPAMEGVVGSGTQMHQSRMFHPVEL